MLKYKFDIMQALKNAGLTTYQIRKEKIFGENTLTKFRTGQIISADNLDRLCSILEMQPGDILEHVPEKED